MFNKYMGNIVDDDDYQMIEIMDIDTDIDMEIMMMSWTENGGLLLTIFNSKILLNIFFISNGMLRYFLVLSGLCVKYKF